MIQTDHLISARQPDPMIVKKKKKKKKKEKKETKRTCRIVDFAVPADHRIKLKENKKRDKYVDLARELENLWNMKVTVVLIVMVSVGTIPKGLAKGLKKTGK